MAKQKIKILKKELPLLKGDLTIDVEALNRLKTIQNRFALKFKERMEKVEAITSEYNDQRIVSLTKAKAETVKIYDSEIKKFQNIAKGLKGVTKTKVKRKAVKKTPVKKK